MFKFYRHLKHVNEVDKINQKAKAMQSNLKFKSGLEVMISRLRVNVVSDNVIITILLDLAIMLDYGDHYVGGYHIHVYEDRGIKQTKIIY